MSEFVECQNCGRRFFAENLDCPYCKDHQDLRDLIDEVQGTATRPTTSGVAILINTFMLLLVAGAGLALLLAPRVDTGRTRAVLLVQAASAVLVLVGLARRRRWGRYAAVCCIVANATVGVVLWGPYPAVLLLLLVPFLSRPVREYLNR